MIALENIPLNHGFEAFLSKTMSMVKRDGNLMETLSDLSVSVLGTKRVYYAKALKFRIAAAAWEVFILEFSALIDENSKRS
jgi:hypothetical protein